MEPDLSVITNIIPDILALPHVLDHILSCRITDCAVIAFDTTKSRTKEIVQETSWLWGDQRWWCLLGGLTLGAYFGFRVGVVSGRAKRFVASRRFMRAAALNSYGGIKAVSVQNVEVPQIVKDSQVLIEVKAASLDPVDLKVCYGYGRGLRNLVNKNNPNFHNRNFPVILGRDGTGVVSEVGSEVHNLKAGDKVWFVVPCCHQGSLGSLLVLDQEHVRHLPPSLGFESGATLPYIGMLVWDMLVTVGGLGPDSCNKGQTVFIWGGVRALERLALQMCSHWGNEVTCMAPTYAHRYLSSLGASQVFSDDMEEVAKFLAQKTKFDVVVNTAGLMAEDICLALAKDEGRVVSALIQSPNLKEYGLYTSILARLLTGMLSVFRENLLGGDRDWRSTCLKGEVLDYLGDLVTKGHIDPVGERIYTLDQTELAFLSLAAGGHKGKLVIKMEEQDQLALSR